MPRSPKKSLRKCASMPSSYRGSRRRRRSRRSKRSRRVSHKSRNKGSRFRGSDVEHRYRSRDDFLARLQEAELRDERAAANIQAISGNGPVVGQMTSTTFTFGDDSSIQIPSQAPGAILTDDQVSKFVFRKDGDNVPSETQPYYLFHVERLRSDMYKVWARRAEGIVSETHIPDETELDVTVTGNSYVIARFGEDGVQTKQSVPTTLAFDVPYKRIDFVHQTFPRSNHTMTIALTDGIHVPGALDQLLRGDDQLRVRFRTLLNKIQERFRTDKRLTNLYDLYST